MTSVLVVDDDEDSRELLAVILESRGFTVSTACSGEACLQALEGSRSEPVIVLTDVEMPGMTGLELCVALRDRFPAIVAIVMSGRATAKVEMQAKEFGAFTFLPKPANIKTLDRVLREVAKRET